MFLCVCVVSFILVILICLLADALLACRCFACLPAKYSLLEIIEYF